MADTVSYGPPISVKYVRTTTGAPSGPPTGFPAYKIGDTAVADDGTQWVCTVAGSPGTWVQIGTGTITGNAAITGTLTVTSANAKSAAIGPTGATNPVFAVDSSVASQADGVSVAGNAAGSGTTFTGTSSGSNAGFAFVPKGNGGTSFGVLQATNTHTIAPNNTITGAGNNQVAITSTSSLITATATGADAAIGINLVPKGTGLVQANGIIVPVYEYVTLQQAAGTAAATFAVTQPFYTFPNDGTTWKVINVSARWSTASSSGVVAVTLDSAAGAPGSGTSQQTGTISTASSANTTVNGTANIGTTCSAGQSLSVVWSGTVTGLVGCVITTVLQRLS